MEIAPGVEIVHTALWIKKDKSIIINDLHLGYEEELHGKGILVPRVQLQDILQGMAVILTKTKCAKVIINGDLKHEFGRISRREWKDVLLFLDFLLAKGKEIIIIQGNHDPVIKPIAETKNVRVVKQYSIGDIDIVHGDKIIESKAKTIIIGHEHPAITVREGSKTEKYKCFLKGKWKRKTLIAVPSFNPLLEGTDILQGQTLSPYLSSIEHFEVFIVSGSRAFAFGTVKEIRTQR